MAREASVERNTKETEIKLKINLDGTGYSDIETGVGFFNHMLDGFTRHGLFDLSVRVHGDLQVDDHHTIEDTGIVLGTALKEAIGDKKGIKRYGSCILPMDESLVLCAIDLSGRPYFVWDAEFTTDRIGDMSTEMVKEFFYAISYACGMNLHIRVLAGGNNHHVAEAMFKSFAKALDAAGKKVGVNFVGGYTALVHKGFSAGDKRLIESIPRALAETDIVCSSVNIGATKAGLNMDAIKLMGQAVKKASELTADRQCIGAAKLVVFCNAPEDNPFMAGAFHGPGEPDCEIHVGVSGPGAVRAALARLPKDAPIDQVAELVKRTAFKITRVGQLVANLASQALGVPAGIIDLSLAPTPAVGDSVANILEEMGLETCGCCGTTACLALLNDAVKKGGVMASNHVGGLSGAFIPVSEDDGMIHAAETGCLTIEKLEAMTAVCSVGIDMVIIPGDTTPAVISALIADEAAIGMVNSKTTAVRVIPAIGRKAGEILDFGGLLGYGPIMPVNQHDPSVFINRGGRLPAPMQSLKN